MIGLIALAGSAVLFVDLSHYQGDSFRAERSSLVTLLGQARIDSLNNILEEPHGVAIFPSDYPGSYVLFMGTSYATSDPASRVPYKANYMFMLGAGSPTEVVFEQLNGNSNVSGKIVMVDPNRNFNYEITLNHEGGISW